MSPTPDLMNSLIVLALSATTLTKIVVDLLRMTRRFPRWVSPFLALSAGIVITLLLLAANGTPLTVAVVAQGILAGVMAAGSAIGVTELQKREHPGDAPWGDPFTLAESVAQVVDTLRPGAPPAAAEAAPHDPPDR